MTSVILFPSEFIYALQSLRGGNLIRSRLFVVALFSCSLLFMFGAQSYGQSYPASTYQDLHWRMIGPFRGGRTRAVAGVPGQSI